MKECGTAYWSKYEVKVALHHARKIVNHAEKITCRVEEKQLAAEAAKNVFDDPALADAIESGSASSKGSPSKAVKKKKAKKSCK